MGAVLAQRVAQELGGILFLPSRLTGECGGRDFESVQTLMAEVFHGHPAHVFVGAAGIAMRAVAPHLGSKATDPAVVVCDQRGKHVVSLLSGHLGGGNDLARKVAKITNGRAVITTASDVEGVPALDVLARDLGLFVADGVKMRAAQAVLAEGGRLRVFDPEGILLTAVEDSGNLEAVAGGDDPEVRVQVRIPSSEDRALLLVPKGLAVGVGCRRGTPAGEIQSAVQTVLDEAGLHPKSVVCLASADLKMDEAGLLAVATALEAEVRFFSASELGAIEAPHPSAMVHKHVGVQSVCEAAAILAGKAGRLIVTKKVFGRVTVAVAE
ncbi:MAG: cobalamin biosynthesis protein CbiG [Deltaproteobacteria bacterium]|nr:cobalamin biosynthesis protein CbiG [Deltaproteobacteria bacterium]